ncbi:MAG TPA: nitroreductase [Nitrospirota bacterium]|nr:nitroreductase [Nitrospirota bacterium]
MSTVTQSLLDRYTVRAFTSDPLSPGVLTKILEPALHTPSWANTQPWEIFVAAGDPLERIRTAYAGMLKNCVPRNPDIAMPREWPDACRMRMETLKAERTSLLERECAEPASLPDLMQMNYRLFNAPVVVYLCMDRCLTPWSLFDLGALSHGIMLTATEQGVGSAVAITLAAHPEIIRRELDIPDSLAVAIGIALGYADPDSPQNKFRSTRRSMGDVARWKGF